MARVRAIVAIVAIALTLEALRAAEGDDQLRQDVKKVSGTIQAASEKQLSRPDVTLGRALFWDARLSGNGKIACASCHLPEDGGADRRKFSLDARGKNTSRNAQTIFNAMMQPKLRWTGDRKSGAHQAEKSLTGSMGLDSPDAVVPLLEANGYEPSFKAAFPDDASPMNVPNYANAIQAYEATLTTPAPFDRFLGGDDDALSAKQKTGIRLFMSTGCIDCHKGPLLGGESIRKFGVAKEYWTATKSDKKDPGLYEATKNDADLYRFRVPMLRNIAKTAPYFHDGSVADLKEAVQVMADVQLGQRLRDSEVSAIVSFLDSLTGEQPKHYSAPTSTK